MTHVISLHMGPLHPAEQWLTLALAFGPFLLLGVVLWWRHREDQREDRREDERTAGAARAADPESLS